MEPKLTFRYDREGDILYLDKRSPYKEQESQELGDDVVVRVNPRTGEVENLEVLFFTARLQRDERLDLPINADLRLTNPQ